jgi:heterotetrameric sarcosine oxidase gamma subunit
MSVDPTPERLSPLHNRHQSLGAHFDLRGGWLVPKAYTSAEDEATVLQESAGLADVSARGKLILKGAHAAAIVSSCLGMAPTKPGDVTETKSDHTLIAKLTPEEFLLLTPPGAERKLSDSLQAEIESQDIFASLVDQTSGLVGLSIFGPKSKGVMKKLCAIDFDTKDLHNFYVVQSSFATVRSTIIGQAQDALPVFELFADGSYGEYLWDTILDAGREFGVHPVGWETIGR